MSSSEEDNPNSHILQDEIDDSERTAIRSELSSLSFEELQKLKEKIGAKVYKEAIFGADKNNHEKPKLFKRQNKNRPREVSSKKTVSVIRSDPIKKKELRDPRFDPLCGEFDKRQFSSDYNFLSELRMQDVKAIRAELKETQDPERELKLRRLLQRMTEQQRANKKKTAEKEKLLKEKINVEQQFKQGKQPRFKNKSELRVEALVKQYEELKGEGASRIQRHLKRRQQKLKKHSQRPPAHVD